MPAALNRGTNYTHTLQNTTPATQRLGELVQAPLRSKKAGANPKRAQRLTITIPVTKPLKDEVACGKRERCQLNEGGSEEQRPGDSR